MYSGSLEGGVFDLSKIDGIVPGSYSLEVAATVPNQSKSIQTTLNFVIEGVINISDVYIGVSESKEAFLSELTTVSEQNSVTSLAASALTNDVLHIAFSINTPSKVGKRFQKPHQVFVKFTHMELGSNSFFVGVSDGQLADSGLSGSKFKVVVSMGKEVETFMHQSGKHIVSILASDTIYGTSLEWIVGTTELTFPVKVVKQHPLYAKALLDESDNTLKPLPEITHIMRPPSARASAFMATIFTFLVMIPLVIFIQFVLSLSPNLNRLKSMSSLLFVCSIIGLVVLILAYWFSMEGASFYQTIRYLCFLVPITAVIGRSAIASVTKVRLEGNKKL